MRLMLVAVNICRSKIAHRSCGVLLDLRRVDSSTALKDVCYHDLGASQEVLQVSFSRIIIQPMNQQALSSVGKPITQPITRTVAKIGQNSNIARTLSCLIFNGMKNVIHSQIVRIAPPHKLLVH